MTSNAIVTAAPVNTPLARLGWQASQYAREARAQNTRRAYGSDWQAFEAFCSEQGLVSLPALPETVALYLTHLAEKGRKVSTIERALVSISQRHRFALQPSPRSSALVAETLRGIRRSIGVAQRGKAPVLAADLRRMLSIVADGLLGIRDRALLLLGFAGAFRRSELVSLDVGDLAFTQDGLEVTIRRSKTDQEGQGRKVGIPYGMTPETCPVRALRAYLEASGITEGAIFRAVSRHGKLASVRLSDRAVALVVKRYAHRVGLDPRQFAGHSLRAGLATSAAKAGKSERAIMAQTGHRSVEMVRRYIRDASLFSDNAAAGLL
jgi:integrase